MFTEGKFFEVFCTGLRFFGYIGSTPRGWKEVQIVTFLEFSKRGRPEALIGVLSEISCIFF